MFKVLQQVLRPMLLDTSGSALQVAISSSSHDIVATVSVIGRFLLQVRQPGTCCQTISVIPCSAKTLLGDQRPMLSDASGFAVQVAISSSSHDIVAKFSVIGLFLLPVRQPRTRCQTISVIPRLAKTLLGDH